MSMPLIRRHDKWFLSNGRACLYAPPFPRWLTTPGFWDETYFADIRCERLLTVLALQGGRPVRWQSRVAGWVPGELELVHSGEEIWARETRYVHPANAWVAEFTFEGPSLDLFAWSLPERRPDGPGAPWQSAELMAMNAEATVWRLSTRWPRELAPDRTAVERESLAPGGEMGDAVDVYFALGASVPTQGALAQMAQRHDDSPRWETSVLPEAWRQGELRAWRHADGEGLLHLVRHLAIEPGTVRIAVGAGLTDAEARAALTQALWDDSRSASQADWRRFFGSVPRLSCDDPHLQAAYDYRWYGLRLNTINQPGLPNIGHPFVAEGIGFFRNFVTYSAQAHLREVAWMHDPALAVGILDNLVANQRPDGSFPGHTYSARPARDFYHADFATGARQLEALHAGSVRPEHRAALERYARYFLELRTQSTDPTHEPTLYDVFDQNETGQEYMSRYQFANERADEWESFRVAGVDATVYATLLFRYLGWDDAALAAVRGLLDRAWDADAEFFCDVATDGRQSPARPATGLYAALVLEGPEAVRTVRRWLLDSAEFGSPFGFPATAMSDPTFRAEATWKDRRLNCPWNGRSWPMTNSHLVDALARAARLDPDLRPAAAEGLRKAVRLLFHEGDAGRPNCYEHYNPLTGVPALYRGYDDYMHSWVVDLILRYAVGVDPLSEQLDPLPLGAEIWCEGVPTARGLIDVRVTPDGIASATRR